MLGFKIRGNLAEIPEKNYPAQEFSKKIYKNHIRLIMRIFEPDINQIRNRTA